MIYFASLPTGSIKIGFTDNLQRRMDQLRAHYGAEPAVLATMPGDRRTEAEIHERFAHLRFGRTEQFRPAADLMEFIGKPLLVGANPEAVEAMPGPDQDTRPVRLDLTPEVHRLLRLVSANYDQSMATCARDAVEAFVRAEAKRLGFKP